MVLMRRGLAGLLALTLASGLGGCSKSEKAEGEHAEEHTESGEHEGGLSEFQLKNGIGPLTEEVKVGPVDHALAAEGEKLFAAKCTACHKLQERYVGPSLGGVATRRTPTYIMNMILNPQEMYEKHPAAKELLGQYMTQMPNLSLTQDQARAVMEYLRDQATRVTVKS
jgi:mono/diheme cytochrome c family protein